MHGLNRLKIGRTATVLVGNWTLVLPSNWSRIDTSHIIWVVRDKADHEPRRGADQSDFDQNVNTLLAKSCDATAIL